MGQSEFVRNTFIITFATLLSKILGSIFRIPLQNIAGDEVLGIFSLVYPVYMVALILSVAGIPVAISKLIAEARAVNDTESIVHIFNTAKVIALLFGILSFAVIFVFSNKIALLLGGPQTQGALIFVSATLLVAPYMAVYRGYFQGFDSMKPTGVSQVIEQLIRVAFILFIAHVLTSNNYDSPTITTYIMSGSVLGALVSLIYLKFTFTNFNKSKSRYQLKLYHLKHWSKKILAVSIPIAIGSITMALFNFADSITIPFSLRSIGFGESEISYQFGIYSRGLVIVQIVTVFASSIILPLIPLISKKLAGNNFEGARLPIERSFFLTQLLSWPAAIGIFALAWPLNKALFTNFEGSMIFAVIGISSVFTSLVIVATGVLQGLNKPRHAAIAILCGVIVKVILNIFLVEGLGLIGAALSTLIVYFILFVIQWALISKIVHLLFLQWKIIFSSLLMGAFIWGATDLFEIENWSRLDAFLFSVLAIFTGMLIYFILISLFKVVSFNNLIKKILDFSSRPSRN